MFKSIFNDLWCSWHRSPRKVKRKRGRGAIWIILPWHPPWRVLGENCLVCMALTSVGARGLLAWMVRGVVHTHTQRTQEALPHKRNNSNAMVAVKSLY